MAPELEPGNPEVGLHGPRETMPMSLTRQATFWMLTIVGLALILWLLHAVLLPFAAGLVLAYLLNPLANRLERAGLSRVVSALIIVGVFLLGFLLVIILVAPLLGNQLAALIAKMPVYVTRLQDLLADPSREWLTKLVGQGVSEIRQSTGDLVKEGVGYFAAVVKSVWSGGEALVSIFSLLIVTPIVAFYLICDWNRMVAAADALIPVPHREVVRYLALQINSTVAGYFRGQTLVVLALGSYYALALTVIGLNFGLLIGITAGLLTFIPYVGSLTGLVLGLGVAIVQFWPDYTKIMVVVAIFLAGQFLEGQLLTPRLVGKRIGLHPVWLMFALLAFGYLFGFLGLLVAVPLAAAAGVLVRFALQRYQTSALYTGVEVKPRIEARRVELG
jgi:predicted PurR-regulated permease PerM